MIDKNVQLFYKVFIDAYWGKISLAAQQDIEQYLNEYDDIQKELNKLIVENIDAINELTELLREKLIKENSSNIKVNLGGGMSASQNFTPTNPIIS